MDQVPFQQLVDVTALPMKLDPSIQTIASAIDVYLLACEQQFSGKHHQARKRTCLRRFVAHLATRQHSLSLADLTLADGQQFLAAVVNATDGTSLSPSIRKGYKSTLRTFSRFLYQTGLTLTDVFFELYIK